MGIGHRRRRRGQPRRRGRAPQGRRWCRGRLRRGGPAEGQVRFGPGGVDLRFGHDGRLVPLRRESQCDLDRLCCQRLGLLDSFRGQQEHSVWRSSSVRERLERLERCRSVVLVGVSDRDLPDCSFSRIRFDHLVFFRYNVASKSAASASYHASKAAAASLSSAGVAPTQLYVRSISFPH